MAKNILIRQRDGEGKGTELHPLTKASNVFINQNSTVADHVVKESTKTDRGHITLKEVSDEALRLQFLLG